MEAKAASALNHPNIITIYDVGSDGGADFIAMEYVPGKTLEQAIAGKPVPAAECLIWSIQIAQALTAANRAGIIHRDLKPGNIIVAAQDRIKLLDFGVAKLIEYHNATEPADVTPTRTMAEVQLTREGQMVRTVAYMSPEQLTGGNVDGRSDIFSFGIVLYEMLTGRRPFGGATSVETAAEILKHEPRAPRALGPDVPPALERVVSHCLRKHPDERFQSIADVAHVLDDARSGVMSSPAAGALASTPRGRTRRTGLLAGAFAVTLAVAAGVAAWVVGRAPAGEPPLLTRLTFDSGLTTDPAVSRDGKLLAFASDRDGRGNLDIWVRQLAGGDALQVTRDPADESEPDFSPDGTKIVYRSNRDGGGIYITSAFGGSEPQMLATAAHSPRFSPDGKYITYYVGEMSGLTRRPMRSNLFVMQLAGGQARPIEPQLAAASHPIWSPDSKHILFCGSDVGDVAAPMDWYVVAVDGGKATRTGAGDILAKQGLSEIIPHFWAAGDEVIFSARLGDSRNLWRIPVSPRNWSAKAPAKRMTFGTGMDSHASLAAVLPSNRLVFSVLNFRVNLWTLPLDRSGTTAGEAKRITDDEAIAGWPDLTANGDLLVFMSNRSGTAQIWTKDLRTGTEIPVTDGPGDNAPAVAPDGSVFAYWTEGESAIYAVTLGATRTQPRSRRKMVEGVGWPDSWTSHGEWLFHSIRTEHWGVQAVHRASGRRYTVFQPSGYDMTYFRPSPDDRWAVASVLEDPASYIQIAPIREAMAVQANDWIRIAEDAAGHDRPVWSSDGTLV